MKKVLVSGANGFVGSAVVRELVKSGYDVTGLVRNPEALVGTDRFVEGVQYYAFSIECADALIDKLKGQQFDTFYHFAWAGTAGAERADYALQLDNVKWSVDCIDVAKKLGCGRFVNSGSVMEKETYDATFAAENKPGLAYIYGATKLAGHAIGKAKAAELGIDYICAMITNAYGVGEVSPRMVNTTLRKCIDGVAPQFTAGTQNYDFIYIDDVARALRLLGEKGKPFCEYVIGSGNAKPLKELLLEMKAAVAPDLDFIFGDIPYTGINQELSFFSTDMIEKDTGFKAEVSFAEGCKLTYDWLKTIE